jgi:hypothetical protein
MPIQSSFHPDVSAVKAEIFPVLGLADSIPGVFSGEWFGSGTYLEKRSPIENLYAPPDGYHQLRLRTSPGPRDPV